MKRLLPIALFTISLSASAVLPKEITRLLGKPGKLTSLYNGKPVQSEDGNTCEVLKSESSDNVIQINAGLSFTPSADLTNAKKESSANATIYTTTYSGKRPGGSECGNSIMTNFVQRVIVDKQSISLVKTFRCNIFERVAIIEKCTVL